MGSLEDLEVLSLVAKVTSELTNHLGIADKNLAEYLIDQHAKCSSLDDFKSQLDGDLPQSLLESIDRLVLTMHPKHKQKKAKASDANGTLKSQEADVEKKARIFKGMTIPDREPGWKEDDDVNGGDGDAAAMDDTFAQLEALAGKKNGHQAEKPRKRSRSPGLFDDTRAQRRKYRNELSEDEDEFGRSKPRRRRSRPRSPRHDRHRDSEKSRHKHRDSYERNDSDEEYRKRRRRRGSDENARPSRGRCDNGLDRPPAREMDDAPVMYKVYPGRVTGVKDFGAFVNLEGVRGKVDGLVHVSNMQEGVRVNHPSDLVSPGQQVHVKVVKIEDRRIGLSMKEVDQATGRDLAPEKRIGFASGANSMSLNGSNGAFDAPVASGSTFGQTRNHKRLTSPERWDIKQLIAAGVYKAQDYPNIDEDYNDRINGVADMDEQEQDIDIEVREDEPPFLAGQTKQSLELSPIRVVKAPDGSMNRAAMSGTSLAKERRELRDAEAKEKAAEKATQADMSAQWQDPMARADDRKFASDFRQPAPKPTDAVPEWKKVIHNPTQSKGKRTDMSIKDQRESLPVFKFRKQLLEAVRQNQLLIVVGDTGSGKTTQLTQFLAEDGWSDNGMIGCTQPRRVAAVSVAKRVAEEVGCRLGEEVGYTIRFEDKTSPNTRIKYMTDGMMEREILIDPNLKRYSVIMLDEAHERTIATDVLFGLLKKALKRRPDLKVIVTSATLDAAKFSEYFNKCPIFTIPGRTFPVEIMYSREPESDYLDAALVTAMQIHLTEPPGDILLFLTGQEEIDTSCEILFERMKALGPSVPELVILPVYSALPSEMQSRIFDPAPPGARKMIIATNIAETSVTIDGIYYVIDPGFVKQNAYDPKLGMNSLVVTPISQAQAKQRAGRAGRTGPGKCFRLYTEAAFQSEMLPTTIPEIQRQELSNTILMLKAMGINDLLHFDFMDPPPTNTMLSALEELYALSALDDEGLLTRIGRKMADFPMMPSLSKVLISSVELRCSEEVLTIVAMVAGESTPFYRPKEKQQQADQKKAKFHDPNGDHLTLLNVYNGWKQSGYNDPWCFENFITQRAMRRAKDVRAQLVTIMNRHRHQIVSCGADTDAVRRALCAGLFRNSARKDPAEGYKTLIEGTPVYLHPSSALFGKAAEHVIYHSLVLTSKEYMHQTTSIDPKWLVEAAPTFFKVAPSDRLSKRKKAERIQPLYNKHAGEDEWRLSAQKRQGRGGGGGTWG